MIEIQEPQAISQAELKRALSEPRLKAYQLNLDEPLKDVLARYRWNGALCMSLHPILGLLEVALRNNLHGAITGLYSTPAWYDLAPSVLMPREAASVIKAKDQLRSKGKPEDPNRIVAELNFGFWTSLMSRDYERRLWPTILTRAFPLMRNRERTRSNIADRLKVLRLLRNRVSHHEPICRRGLRQGYPSYSLSERVSATSTPVGSPPTRFQSSSRSIEVSTRRSHLHR